MLLRSSMYIFRISFLFTGIRIGVNAHSTAVSSRVSVCSTGTFTCRHINRIHAFAFKLKILSQFRAHPRIHNSSYGFNCISAAMIYNPNVCIFWMNFVLLLLVAECSINCFLLILLLLFSASNCFVWIFFSSFWCTQCELQTFRMKLYGIIYIIYR